MLLAIDTTLGTSIAVVDRDHGVLYEVAESDRTNHATVIGTLITQALTLSETDPVSLSGVAVGIGPGPNHNVGIGIAAAHGFATALRKPVVRVITHDAVMLNQPHPALVVTDAGDGLTAWTAYGAPDPQFHLPNRLSEPTFTPSGESIDPRTHFDGRRILPQEISAGNVGMLAERLFAAGRPFARKEPYLSPRKPNEGIPLLDNK
jgi:tRNA threonylcarbamoyl adenosine modification protein YeaZ